MLSFNTFIAAYFCASLNPAKVSAGKSDDLIGRLASDDGDGDGDGGDGEAAATTVWASGRELALGVLATLPTAKPNTSPTSKATITFGFIF